VYRSDLPVLGSSTKTRVDGSKSLVTCVEVFIIAVGPSAKIGPQDDKLEVLGTNEGLKVLNTNVHQNTF